MKPKIHTIFFDDSIYNQSAALLRLKLDGYTESEPIVTPGAIAFAQRDGVVIPGSKKSLGKGIWATLTKSKKDGEDEEDDDKATMDDAKIEKADTDTEDDEDDDVDEPSELEESAEDDDGEEIPADAEVAAEEGEDNGLNDESEATDEDTEEPENLTPQDADPEKLRADARDLAEVVKHFQLLLDHFSAPDVSERTSQSAAAEIYAKVSADITTLLADLKKIFISNYPDAAIEAMVSGGEQVDNSAAGDMPDAYQEQTEQTDLDNTDEDDQDVIKSLRAIDQALKPISTRVKSWLAVAKS